MATIMQRRTVIYCGECGMPPEFCEYGPDYETHCKSWLLKNHPNIYTGLKALRKGGNDENDPTSTGTDSANAVQQPSEPWTTEERLCKFYEQYQPEKIDGCAAILEKYADREDQLFAALVKKYGAEPEDPYYLDSDDDDSDDGGGKKKSSNKKEKDIGDLSLDEKSRKKKRRGAAAKKLDIVDTRIVIQKVFRNKKKAITIIVGMDTVPDIKLKEVAKAFSKRFAGSSSVKDTPAGKKDIIIQGDHMDDVAKMIVEKFKVPAESVFLDIDGQFVCVK